MLPINTIREIIRIDSISPLMSDRKKAEIAKCSHQSVGRLKKKLKKLAINHLIALQFKDKELLEALYPKACGVESNCREPNYEEHYKQSTLKKGKSKTVLYLEYRAEDPKTALCKSQYFAKVRKYMKKYRLAMRQQHFAGEVVFIDYAGTKVFYNKKGKKVWLKVFVGVLGASKKVFAFATPGERTIDWINSWLRIHLKKCHFWSVLMIYWSNKCSAIEINALIRYSDKLIYVGPMRGSVILILHCKKV
tara:strand:- start:5894 stop:6640 length:747 start_codon:yes stop_codon:yes gene_type:complete